MQARGHRERDVHKGLLVTPSTLPAGSSVLYLNLDSSHLTIVGTTFLARKGLSNALHRRDCVINLFGLSREFLKH